MVYSQEEKSMWLEDWKQSGKKAWTYAKENGIIPQTFCSWVKRAGEEKKPTGFVEIPKQLMRPIVQSQEMVIATGGLKIHIPLSVCGEELETILAAIGRLK